MKKHNGFCVIDNTDNFIEYSFAKFDVNSRLRCVASLQKDWSALEAEGYKCVKVCLQVVE